MVQGHFSIAKEEIQIFPESGQRSRGWSLDRGGEEKKGYIGVHTGGRGCALSPELKSHWLGVESKGVRAGGMLA